MNVHAIEKVEKKGFCGEIISFVSQFSKTIAASILHLKALTKTSHTSLWYTQSVHFIIVIIEKAHLHKSCLAKRPCFSSSNSPVVDLNQ